MYKKQVDKNHYNNKYDYRGRFISYYHQQRIISQLAAAQDSTLELLEVGPGTKFLQKYMGNTISYKCIDIASDIEPDFIGSILDLSTIHNLGKYDVVCAFQVLEHLEYKDAERALRELSNTSKDYVLISIPQAYLYLSYWLKVSKLRPLTINLSLPVPRAHKFDGQHYWELGARGYSKKRFRQSIADAGLDILSEFSDPLNPYHRFFLCKKDIG